MILHKGHSIVLLLAIVISMPCVAQYKKERGIFYPKDYKTKVQETAYRLNKTSTDTLHYKVLQKIKNDFVVNTGCGDYGADQRIINIASDDSGGFLCAWIDDRTGFNQVDAQLFDKNGNKSGQVIHVSETTNSWNSDPHIVYNRVSKEYVVLWAESGYDIRFQRISVSGQQIGDNLTANQLFATNTNNPSAAVDSSGNFIVTWYSDVNCCSNSVPYCRVLDKEGNAITDQWSLTSPGVEYVNSFGWDDRIAADSAGRSVIVWSTYVNGRSRIVLQVVNQTGSLLENRVVVSDSTDSTNHFFPTIAGTRDGHFLILWSSSSGVDARIYQIDSGFVTDQFTITNLPQYWITYAASSDNRNTFFVSWISDHIYGQTVSAQGAVAGSPKLLSFPTTASPLDYPRLSKGLFGRLYLTYDSYVRTEEVVMLQAFDLAFNPIGFSVNPVDDSCSAWQTSPVLKYNQFGRSLVVWDDQRNGYHDLYGQVLDESGNPISSNILISDSTVVHWPANPVIITDGAGDFIVSFSAGDYSSRNVILQKISQTGAKIGVNKILSNEYYSIQQSVLAENEPGDILVCWYNQASTTPPLNVQQLKADFTPSTGTTVLLNNSSAFPKKIICVSANSNFDILAVWLDYDYQSYKTGTIIKAMIFDKGGRAVTDTLKLGLVSGYPDYYTGTCQIDTERNIVLLGFDEMSGYYGLVNVLRRYATDGKVLKNSIEINDLPPHLQIIRFENKKAFISWNSLQSVNAIFFDDNFSTLTPIHLQDLSLIPWNVNTSVYSADISGGKIQVSYESVKNPRYGFDIYLNTQLLPQVDFSYVSPTLERVSAVFPNPTSGIATLHYEIGATNYVTISVFNVIGQKIFDIESGTKSPGIYDVRFNTRVLPSGIYFFRYKGVQNYLQKFLVVK